MVFLVLFGFQLALFGVLLLASERGTARRWSYAEVALLAVCAPLLVLGWTALHGGAASAAKAGGLVGLWLLLFSRFSHLLMGTPTGEHTVEGVLAELEGLYAQAGDPEGAGVVRARREQLEAAPTAGDRADALRSIVGLARPGNGRFSDRYTGAGTVDSRLAQLWPVLGALAARRLPRPRR